MSFPWSKLKAREIEILALPSVGADMKRIDSLRALIDDCRHDPNAESSICYHGALALIYEADSEFEKAIRHREEEIAKIHHLHELELQNPTGGYALQNYGISDLADRERRLKDLYARRQS